MVPAWSHKPNDDSSILSPATMWKDKQVRRQKFNERRQARKRLLRKLKEGKSCKECGWKEHTEILQFHHRDPSTKDFDFSGSEIGNLSIKRILDEIDKCDLLCPNCHLWHHYQETAKD